MASLKSWRDIFMFLLSSLITFSLVLGAKCREGFHETEKEYCCWPASCSKNQQFHLCMQDHGSDTCKPCEDGLINPEQIETNKWSYQYDVCHAPDCECAPEAVLLDPEECMKSGIAICFCDRKEWFYGGDPLNCQKANNTLKRSAMERGMELKLNGTTGKCSPGYFKAKSGSSICNPHSKCPEGHSVEIPGTTLKDNICKRDPSTSVPTLPREPTSPSPISPDKEHENNPIYVPVYIWVLVGLGVTLIIVALAVLIILKNRRKAAVQMRNNVGETFDPEKGSLEQPLIEVNKKKHPSASTVSSQNQDCCNKSEDSFLAANQRQEPNEQGPQEQRQLFERKKDPSESGKTHTLYHEDQIELGGSSLDFSSLFDSHPSSGMTSGGNSISNLLQTSVPQDSHGRSLQATSEDLGIGLSADSKVNEIQKSGQTQGREEQPVSGDY